MTGPDGSSHRPRRVRLAWIAAAVVAAVLATRSDGFTAWALAIVAVGGGVNGLLGDRAPDGTAGYELLIESDAPTRSIDVIWLVRLGTGCSLLEAQERMSERAPMSIDLEVPLPRRRDAERTAAAIEGVTLRPLGDT